MYYCKTKYGQVHRHNKIDFNKNCPFDLVSSTWMIFTTFTKISINAIISNESVSHRKLQRMHLNFRMF